MIMDGWMVWGPKNWCAIEIGKVLIQMTKLTTAAWKGKELTGDHAGTVERKCHSRLRVLNYLTSKSQTTFWWQCQTSIPE